MKDTKLPIAVWLGMLPEPIRSEAIEEHLATLPNKSDFEVKKQSDAIIYGIVWRGTKQGNHFWAKFHYELENLGL